MKRIVIAVAAALALGFAGMAVFAPSPAAAENVVATDIARHGGVAAVIDGLVADGTLSAEQGEAVKQALAEEFDGRKHPRWHRPCRGQILNFVAEVIGIEPGQVMSQLQQGKTLVEIAAEEGVGESALIEALLAPIFERIDAAEAAGKIDADRAAELKENATTRVTNMVNSEFDPSRGHRNTDAPGGSGTGL